MSQKRGPKNSRHATQEFFSLGGVTQPSVPSNSNQGQGKLTQKRPLNNDGPFQPPVMSAKRPNLNSPLQNVSPSMSPIPQQSVIRSPISAMQRPTWEERAILVPSRDLKDKVLQYDESDQEDMIERLLCGAAKQLREQKTRPDSCLVLSLLYLAKIRPLFFCKADASTKVVDAFSSLLNRDSLNNFVKTKNNLVPVLVVNLFHRAFHDESSWPENFIKLYVEDSLGDRVWVDNEECKEFVDIIIASFKTKLPQKSQLQTSDVSNTQRLSENLLIGDDSMGDDASCSSNPSTHSDHGVRSTADSSGNLISRYAENEDFVIRYVTDVVNDQLNRRPNVNDISRNVLKLLMITAGIRNVRLLAMQKLEIWFQNPKLSRPTQDLMLTICLNCNESDTETLAYMLKMRFKNNTFIKHYIQCFKELLNKEDSTFDIVLQKVINNELAGVRNTNNMHLISIIFLHKGDRASVVLARIFLEIVFKKEDFLRALRLLLREIVRTLRHEHINFFLFAQALLDESKAHSETAEFAKLDEDVKRRAPAMIIDLVTNVILLSIGNNVREAFNTTRSDRREVIRNFQLQVASIQRRAVEWVLNTMFLSFPCDHSKKFAKDILNKVLFVNDFECYFKIDNWPPENDRSFVFRVVTEIPLFQETMIMILDLIFKKEILINSNEICEFSYQLVVRAANIYQDPDLNYPVFLNFTADCKLIAKRLFDRCFYNYPENTVFPVGYTPPCLAIIDLYLKVWFQLFILAAHMPATYGTFCWSNYPMFRLLVEMAITNNFQYPPKSNEDLLGKEMQTLQLEKVKILEFENYLAGNQEINETNSYLLTTLITCDPHGFPRRPSTPFLEDLRIKCSRFRLHQLLYQSRNPDFLLITIEQQQSRIGPQVIAPMPWLVELVESNENNFGLLPIQCLCEFLFGQISEELASTSALHETTKAERARKKDKRRKQIRLIGHLQLLIQQVGHEHVQNLLSFLIDRLSSLQSMARTLTYKALYLIVTMKTEECLATLDEANLPSLVPAQAPDWLQTKFVKYLKSDAQIKAVCSAMVLALDLEADPVRICEYLDFIASRVDIPDEQLAYNCALLLIQRHNIATFILFYSRDCSLKTKFLSSVVKIFSLYIDSVLKVDFNKSKPNDWLCIKFCTMPKIVSLHPSILYGAILVLSYVENLQTSHYDNLFKLFFGEDGNSLPMAFSDFDAKKSQQILPEWLALRLLSSNSNEIINLVICNFKNEHFIRFLDHYGVSSTAMTRILQTLDKLNVSESRLVKSMEFDRQLMLNTLQVNWMKGLNCGVKFAKAHLNYKGDGKEDGVEMMPVSSKTKKDEKIEREHKLESFKKDDILKVFKDKDVRRLMYLSRVIASELEEKNVKNKKLTKLFLSEFNSNMEKLVDLITNGSFNSIFNVIIALVLKDSKHYGLNVDFQSIRKSLLPLKLEAGSIEKVTFYKTFEREPQKSKKSKQAKKKATILKSHDDLVKFLKNFSFVVGDDAKNPAWCEIFKDLAVEKFYNKDTELEDSNACLQSVIFSRNRPYFLSMLLHKSNFSTLNHCIEYLLNVDEDEEETADEQHQLNPSAILNFLTICINSPKLSIGREDAEGGSKVCAKNENVLQLNNEQIRKLIHYVVLENAVSKRIDLVVKSCCIDSCQLDFLIGILKGFTEEKDEKIALELYTRLYLHIPNIGLPSNLLDDHLQLIQRGPSFIDKVTHNLISSFTFVDGSSLNEEQIRFWELAILKVASQHPLLLIRQLPMIPALLGGKVSLLNYEAFRSLGLVKIFYKFLNILRLLRPHLWTKQSRGVMQILDLYMDFFMAYYYIPRHKRPNEEIVPLLQLFIDLLDDWLKHDSDAANIWIKSQKQALTELSITYHHEQHQIRSIISGLHSQNQDHLTKSCHDSLLKLRCAQFNQEKLIITLNETSKQSDRMPEIAEYLLDEVRTYLMNPSTTEIAFKLSIKALQHNPRLSKSIISTYLRCFRSDSSDVVKQALDHLPKFVILAQEYRHLTMKKAFELAIAGNPTAVTKLNESFSALKSQLGF